LLVCLFVCLFVFCVGVCDRSLQNTPSMARPMPHARRRAGMADSRLAAQECAVRALVRHHPRRALPHTGTAQLSMRRARPKASTVLSASRASARVATPTDPVACEHPIPHKSKAATEAEIDTEALACAAARGARRRDALARAACTSRRCGRRLHGACCSTCHAFVTAAGDDRRRDGCARLRRRVRDFKALAIPHTSGSPRCAARDADVPHDVDRYIECHYSAATQLQPRTLLEGPMIKYHDKQGF
jgi:hypothetical protein